MKCCSATLLGPSSIRDRWMDADQPWRARWAAYVARLKPCCGSLALSVMWYVLTVSQVGAIARFE
eukprot:scaffold37893_cov87-Phaeocystis_antarctica.AAC.1